MPEAFDLNSGEVLEHWPVAFALREILANSLDEQLLTDTLTPDVLRIRPGRWAIRDYGRGLRYQHLTQSENAEKLAHPAVIGKFGFGLNDDLTTEAVIEAFRSASFTSPCISGKLSRIELGQYDASSRSHSR